MKSISEHFTDKEFAMLLKAKGKKTWHDFILSHIVIQEKVAE